MPDRLNIKDGWLIIDKPKGITSHDVINQVRKLLGIKRIGHLGTLDPNATGVLILAINQATKFIPYLKDHSKTYLADIHFGRSFDTDDLTGEEISSCSNNFSYQDFLEKIETFKGKQNQKPPLYSAKKVKGKKLYEYARAKKEVEIKAVPIEIKELEVLNNENFPENVSLKVSCSRGTYIRSLARDLGLSLNSLGALGELRRIQSGTFEIKDALNLEELTIDNINNHILPINKGLNYKEINVDSNKLKKLLFGQKIDLSENNLSPGEIVLIMSENVFYGIGEIEGSYLKPKRLLKTEKL